jgi:tetratricopeptide (TPR) repeat protein
VRRQTSENDSCIDCHMPRYATSDIAHTASTDHRILRDPAKHNATSDTPTTDELNIVPFYSLQVDPNDKEMARNFAVGMIQIFSQRATTPGRQVGPVLRLLEEAVQRDATDFEAWEALAQGYTYVKRPEDALRSYESVLAKAPRREIALARAALLAESQSQFDKARDYLSRAIESNPGEASYRQNLAQLLAHQERWAEARTHCAAWLELDPANIEARALWVSCLLRTGDKAQAKAEFEKIERLRPANLPILQARFQVELRSR